MNYAILDHLLLRFNKRIEYQNREWVWIETIDDSELIVHGKTPGYTRDDAYEDALRDILGIVPIADEKEH